MRGLGDLPSATSLTPPCPGLCFQAPVMNYWPALPTPVLLRPRASGRGPWGLPGHAGRDGWTRGHSFGGLMLSVGRKSSAPLPFVSGYLIPLTGLSRPPPPCRVTPARGRHRHPSPPQGTASTRQRCFRCGGCSESPPPPMILLCVSGHAGAQGSVSDTPALHRRQGGGQRLGLGFRSQLPSNLGDYCHQQTHTRMRHINWLKDRNINPGFPCL